MRVCSDESFLLFDARSLSGFFVKLIQRRSKTKHQDSRLIGAAMQGIAPLKQLCDDVKMQPRTVL